MNWEYRDFEGNGPLLQRQSQLLLINLRKGVVSPENSASDARESHRFLFSGLTPEGHEYFAGHYRGEDFPRLKLYEVTVGADPRVGVPAYLVSQAMGSFSRQISAAIVACKKGWELPNSILSAEHKIIYLVKFSCSFLVEFLRVHPYANGNGHIGRFLIFCFLAPFGIWPRRWPLDESPPYGALISQYRDGNCVPLERFVLNCVIGK